MLRESLKHNSVGFSIFGVEILLGFKSEHWPLRWKAVSNGSRRLALLIPTRVQSLPLYSETISFQYRAISLTVIIQLLRSPVSLVVFKVPETTCATLELGGKKIRMMCYLALATDIMCPHGFFKEIVDYAETSIEHWSWLGQ